MIGTRSIGFIVAALVAAGATMAVCFGDALALAPRSAPLTVEAVAPAQFGAPTRPLDVLQNANPWLTAVPNGRESLRGKVVIVNFWTYSCINSLRALPYLRAWSDRYASKGLVVVGVHTPEFEFEKNPANVRLASKQLGIAYPNVQDNEFSVWRNFGNDGWPGFYFIDAKGQIRGSRVGEGNYPASEQLIRKLLTEAGHDPSGIPATPVIAKGIEAQADWANLGSPEAYLGYGKAVNFASPGGIRRNVASQYAAASQLSRNQWDLGGTWTVGREFATLDGNAGAIRFRFRARDAHLVLGGAPDGRSIRFRVMLDGAPPGADHGTDIDASGWGEVTTDRLYQLVRQTREIDDRTVTIEFSRPGVRAYVLTFG